jgi:hypothetical protein
MKSPLSSVTIWGLVTTAAATFGLPAIDPTASKAQLVIQILGLLLAAYGRWRKGDLSLTGKAPVAPLLALVAAPFLLGGCQALGLNPAAQAPAYSGVGVLVVGSDNEAKLYAKGDQSGATGASGSASQSLEIPQETVDALIGAAQQLIAAGNPAAAAGILDALKSAHDAKKAPKAPAPVKAQEPVPAVPVAPAPLPEPVK